MAESRLPGRPRVSLVKSVRRVLWTYLRSRPNELDGNWLAAWEWADACRNMRGLYNFSKRPTPWPSPSEIATQYLLLAMAGMRDDFQLRLPMHAKEAITPNVSLKLAATDAARQQLLIGALPIEVTA